jgi:hypothetical protein
MQVKREHLAGLELALSVADTVCSDSINVGQLEQLIAEAKAAPEDARPWAPDADLVELLETVVPALHNLSERSLGIEYFILAERVLSKLAELQK